MSTSHEHTDYVAFASHQLSAVISWTHLTNKRCVSFHVWPKYGIEGETEIGFTGKAYTCQNVVVIVKLSI